MAASNAYFIYRYSADAGLRAKASQMVAAEQKSGPTKKFLKLFVEKVLGNQKETAEVSFEDRLKLENAVRELNDSEILAAWNKFVDSQTSGEAQENLRALISLLVGRI